MNGMVSDSDSTTASTCAIANTCIVLVHGIGANRIIMWPLAARLRRAGYRVENWGYPSLFADIRSHADRLAERLTQIGADESVGSICLVGHSMGCIVIRATLAADAELDESVLKKLDSAVLLAPPNAGSPKADFFAPLLSWISKPSAQLTTAPDSFVNSLPRKTGMPTAVIAVRHDFVVPLASTHLDTQLDHTVVGGIHSTVVMRRDVVDLIRNFIEYRSFAADASTGSRTPSKYDLPANQSAAES